MQKRVADDLHGETTLAEHLFLEKVDRFDVAAGRFALCACRLAKRLEVVFSLEQPGSLLHGRDIERRAVPPGELAGKQRRRTSHDDTVAIHPKDGIEACRKLGRGKAHTRDAKVVGRERVERRHDFARLATRELLYVELQRDGLLERMNARIGPAGTYRLDRMPKQRGKRALELALNRVNPGVLLLGKARIGPSVVRECDDERHLLRTVQSVHTTPAPLQYLSF